MANRINTLSGREKATIFLSLLGAETSVRILRYLPDELADIIAEGINHLPNPSPESLTAVLQEFESYLALPQSEEAPIQRIGEPPKPKTPKRSYGILLYERPQMAAFVLNMLPTQEKTEALQGIPRDKMVVEELSRHLRPSAFHAKLEQKIKEHFSGKIF